MRIPAYTYNCGMHCAQCARLRFPSLEDCRLDQNGIPYASVDDWGYHPVPVYQEDLGIDRGFYCQTCLKELP